VSGRELERFALLADLDEAQRDELAGELEVRVIDPGAVVFEEGSPGDGLVLVAMGEVRVASARSAGSERFGPGTALGALSLVVRGRRESSAHAHSRARLLLLDRAGYRRLVEAAPRTACALLEAILVDCAEVMRGGLDAAHEGAAPHGIDRRAATH
jgi:CRP-like cAMP-binding protein